MKRFTWTLYIALTALGMGIIGAYLGLSAQDVCETQTAAIDSLRTWQVQHDCEHGETHYESREEIMAESVGG